MELSYISPNQNRTPTLGLKETLTPKEESSKVSLQGHAQALSASQKAGWYSWTTQEVMTPFAYFNCVIWDLVL
jgi:hypothetical protein